MLVDGPQFDASLREGGGDGAMKRERGVVTTNGILLAPDLTATVKLERVW
jgi:hypothetical protein